MDHPKGSDIIQPSFLELFESAPGLYVILKPEDFQIVAVSDSYLEVTFTERENIVGKALFEVFPGAPDKPWAEGARNLRDSLELVKKRRRCDVMAVQQYPIRRPAGLGGGFEERWWSPVNSPVCGQ
jgi:hypothetical protein